MPLHIYNGLSFVRSSWNTEYSRWTVLHPTQSNWQLSARMLKERSPDDKSKNESYIQFLTLSLNFSKPKFTRYQTVFSKTLLIPTPSTLSVVFVR